jgi:TolA-binding protein
MADEGKKQDPGQTQDPGEGSGKTQQPGGDQQPGPVPYERFKEVNDQLKQMSDRLAEIEQERKEAEERQLKDQEKWQELAEKRAQELAAERRARLRLQVASSKGIPADLADRLQGETADEMAADADRMLEYLKPSEGPGVPPKKPGGGSTKLDLESMSPEEIREKKGELWDQEFSGSQ